MTEDDRLLSPGEVAAMFRVEAKTVTRWAREGKLRAHTRTAGGHRRYLESDVRRLMAARGGNSS